MKECSGDTFFNTMQDIDIIVTYNDPSGAVRISTVKSRDLSASWIWRSPSDEDHHHTLSSQVYVYACDNSNEVGLEIQSL